MGMSFLVNRGGSTYDMTSLVESVTWSGQKSRAPRTLEVSLVDSDRSGDDRPNINVDQGSTCGFYWDNNELFRGIIMRTSQSSKRKMTLKAYDSAVYLANNTDTFVFSKKKASQIFTEICARFELDCTSVDTEFVINKFTKPNVTAIDAIWGALARTYRATGKRFYVISEKGVLKLIARADNVVQWVFEEGSNLLSYSLDRSIEDVRTRVKIYSDANETLAEAKDSALEAIIGIMQHSESGDTEKDANLKAEAQTILNEKKVTSESFTIECMGIPDVYSGKAVYIKIPYLGMDRTFYVDEDTHTFEGEKHTMNLTLNAANDIQKADEEDEDIE